MFCNQLRKIRTAHHLTQVQLARHLHVSKQSVSNWENNNILPSVEQILRMAEFFGCTTDYLLQEGSRQDFLDVTGLTDRQTAHVQQIVRDMKEMNRSYSGREDEL